MKMKQKNSTPTAKRNRRIRLCMFVSGLSVFAQLYLFQPLLPELCQFFGVEMAASSLAVSLSTIGMAAGLLFFAFTADSIARERLMGMALIASSLLTLATAFAVSFPLLLALSFLKGATLAGVSAVALAYLTEEIDKTVIGAAISLYLSGNTIGGMSGRVAGTLIAGWHGWQAAAVGIGIASLLLGMLFFRLIPHSTNFRPVPVSFHTKSRQMHRLLSQHTFLSMFLIATLIMGTFVSVYNYISFILSSPAFHLPHHLIAMVFLMYTTGVAGSFVAGNLSDRHAPEKLLQGFLLLMGAGLLMLFHLRLWSIVGGLGVFTFAFFAAHTVASRIVSVNASEAKSSATSLYWLFYYAGSGIVGTLTGLVLSHFDWNVFLAVLLGLTALAFITSAAHSPALHAVAARLRLHHR